MTKTFFSITLDLELCCYFQLLEAKITQFFVLRFCILISIPIANFLTGMIAAVVIYSYLGFLSELTNTPIKELPISGPDLVFITYPAALSLLPYPRLWIFLFFFTLILIGIDSQFGMVEVISYTIIDFKPKIRNRHLSEPSIRAIVCGCIFIGGLIFATREGFNIIGLVNSYCVFLPMILVGSVHLYVFGSLTSNQGRLQRKYRTNKSLHQRENPRIHFFLYKKYCPIFFPFDFDRLPVSNILFLRGKPQFMDDLVNNSIDLCDCSICL